MRPTVTRFAIAAVFTLTASASYAQSSLPRPDLTPGATNPEVTPDTIDNTICASGWTQTVRPPAQYTTQLKRQQIRQYGYADRKLRDFEEDHLIALGIGGAPRDPHNLWPEPRHPADGWTVAKKDQLEVTLQKLVCAHRVPLAEAQRAMADNWTAVYQKYEDMWRNR
ncbi:MAG: hypothetical protein ACJ8AW_15175 [Rhodopila sp.]